MRDQLHFHPHDDIGVVNAHRQSESTADSQATPASRDELLARAMSLLERHVTTGKGLSGAMAVAFERECICTIALIGDRLGITPFRTTKTLQRVSETAGGEDTAQTATE